MLGIGVTAAIASAVDRALLEPLPFKDPDRLVTVYRVAAHANANTWPLSAPNYKDLAAGSHQIQSMAAIASGSALVTLHDEAIQASRFRVTGNFFDILGVQALNGRLLEPSDDDAGQNRVVVISEEFWRKYFGGDPNIVSKTVQVNGEAATIVGVLPHGFRVPHGASVIRADIWEPMRFTASELGERGSNYLQSIGRLAPGATVDGARQELAALYERLDEVFGDQRGESARAVPLQADGVSTVRTPLLLLFGAVVMVLLIAATNVASLLLARGVQRQREMAVRTAIGASRWDVMRPVLAESLLIAATGAVLGIGLSLLGVSTIGRLATLRMPQLIGLTVDMRIVAFAFALSALVAVFCGAIPAWRATQVDPQDAMRGGRGGGAGRGQHRALNALVVVEVALSLVLLLGAGLMLKGFTKLLESNPGFDPSQMLAMDVRISPQAYAEGTTARQFLDPAIEAIKRDPAVAGAGAISLLPYDNWGNNFGIRYEGQPADNAAKRPVTESRVVTPGFFDVTRQHLLSGRLLRTSDEGAPHAADVVLVNEALVKRDFAGREPLGKRFYTGDTTFATIVGVVSDIKNSGPVRPPAPEIYQTYRQAEAGVSGFEFVVRAKGDDPLALSKSVQAAIRSVDNGAAVSRIRPMSVVISDSIGQPRFLFSLMSVFAAVALVLAVAGIYGVMSYVVAQRTRELGIRAALGSTGARTVRLVARHGAMLVGGGIVLGCMAAGAVTGLMQSMLYGVSPHDALTWIVAAAAIVVAGFAAVLIPSLRATRVDPMSAIRTE
jgi:predicted permease